MPISHASQNIAVVGSGLAGLSAACTLAARGHKVTVFEKSPWLGGKAAVLAKDGYRFDMGPTILTMPAVLKRIWAEAGRRMEDDLKLIELDPQWRCFYEGGSKLDLLADENAMVAYLDREAPGSGEELSKVLELLAENGSDLRELFLLEIGRRPPRHDRFPRGLSAENGRRSHGHAYGPLGRGNGKEVHPRLACCSNVRSFCAICWLLADGIARRVMRHRPYADWPGRMVSGGRDASRSRGAYQTRNRIRR